MDIIKSMLLASEWPSGVWESIIKWFAGVGSIGVAIILLTICIKLVLFPLDFWQKKSSRKMTESQAIMKPELDEIQEKYKNNPQLMQTKQQEVYRKYNAMNSMKSGCVVMLVYMIITMVVFFTLFSGLTNISRSKINYEYSILQQTYVTTLNDTGDEQKAKDSVTAKYDEIRESFLSIKNIWRPDNWSSVFPTGEEFLKSTSTNFGVYDYEAAEGSVKYLVLSTNAEKLKDSAEKEYIQPYESLDGVIYLVKIEDKADLTSVTIGDKTYTNLVYGTPEEKQSNAEATAKIAREQFVADFNKVTAGINEKFSGQWNGYLILVVLAGAITFLSSWLSTLGVKTKDKKGNEVKGAKPKPTMGIILALVMVFFTISYTSAFAIYIITNSLVGMLLNFLTNIILNKVGNKKEKKDKDVVVADYVRK